MSGDVFSKVARRMWVDSKFRGLSRPQPNAQDLWIYLLTGPHNTTIPGLFIKGELSLAEDLDWDVDATRACMREILEAGMAKIDRRLRLVWLPNALAHNMPRTSKNVLGWATAWKLLPQCELLGEAAAAIRAGLAARSAKLAAAFDSVVSGDALAPDEDAPDDDAGDEAPTSSRSNADRISDGIKDPVRNRSQEQEKEKEKKIPPSGGVRAGARAAPPEAPRVSGDGLLEADLLPEELQILEALRVRPPGLHPMSPAPLARVATPKNARYLAAQAGPTGRLELPDVLLAVHQAADEEAGRVVATSPTEIEKLWAMVRGFVRKATRGEAAASGWSAVAQPAVDAGLQDWAARRWVEARQKRRLPAQEPDPKLIAEVCALAAKAAEAVQPDGDGWRPTVQQTVRFWCQRYLAEREGRAGGVEDRGYPLGWLPSRCREYPTPKRRDVDRAESSQPANAEPQEALPEPSASQDDPERHPPVRRAPEPEPAGTPAPPEVLAALAGGLFRSASSTRPAGGPS